MKLAARIPASSAEADHPVEAPRTVEAAGEEDPQHVEKDHRDQDVGAPVVDVPHQAAKEN